jgi:hypothetical protein
MMSTFDSESTDVRSIALFRARDLEETQFDLDFIDGFMCDVLEVVVDTRGGIVLVLGTGGPHVELHLGLGLPQIHVYWSGQHASTVVNLSTQTLDDLNLGALWHTAMANALANPPYEG